MTGQRRTPYPTSCLFHWLGSRIGMPRDKASLLPRKEAEGQYFDSNWAPVIRGGIGRYYESEHDLLVVGIPCTDRQHITEIDTLIPSVSIWRRPQANDTKSPSQTRNRLQELLEGRYEGLVSGYQQSSLYDYHAKEATCFS